MPNTLTNLLYHLVFSTKDRKALIQDELRDELYSYLAGIIRGEKGKTIIIGGTKDHVHILAKLPQSVTVSNMLQHIKDNSSKWFNEKKFIPYRFYWQRGYAAFTVSESMVDTVSRYIQNQQSHHKNTTFKEEFLMLLKKHNIEYNEEFLWD